MKSDQLQLGLKAGDLSIEIIFGDAQVGSYLIKLYDEDGINGVEIKNGSNVKEKEVEIVNVGKVAGLNKKIIDWTLAITSPSGQSGEFYSATLIFRQGGNIVNDGTWQQAGPLQGSKVLYSNARLLVS